MANEPEKKEQLSPEDIDLEETKHRCAAIIWLLILRCCVCKGFRLSGAFATWIGFLEVLYVNRGVLRETTEATGWLSGLCSGQVALRHLYHTSDRPLVVFYTSPSCGPCRSLKPIVFKLADEYHDKVNRLRCSSGQCPRLVYAACALPSPCVGSR